MFSVLSCQLVLLNTDPIGTQKVPNITVKKFQLRTRYFSFKQLFLKIIPIFEMVYFSILSVDYAFRLKNIARMIFWK